MSLKIHIHDRIYSSWDVYHISDNSLSTISIDPISNKLLSGDIIDEKGQMIDSPVRNTKNLAGILILHKTYGRSKGNSGKLYYKCIPNDKRIPEFLIPYEEKHIGFNKATINKFILFKFSHWNDKHPIGTLNHVIGNVTDMSSFYEYQLQCKDLVKSIKKFTSDANNSYKLLGATIEPKGSLCDLTYKLQDRRNDYVISIDPQSSTDLDDAFSIKNNVISIYIANVPVLLDHLKLWASFSERISTIYLPDRKCAMLPPLLSENLCSLLEGQERCALCMDIEVNCEDGSIVKVNLLPSVIKVSKNYVYNEAALLNDSTYKRVYSSVLAMNKKQKYMREINDSHDVVAYLMLLINSKCADLLNDHQTGIFRIINIKEPLKEQEQEQEQGCPTTMLSDTYNLIKMWQMSCGQYTSYENNIGHQLINSGMGVNNYVHISSPIRRLVDLLNMLKLQSKLGIPLSNEALDFYDTWEKQLTYINTTMRSIRKIQTDCSLLHLCVTNSLVLEEIYEGYLFDKITRPNKLFQYTIYIPKIKMFTRINIYEEYPHYAAGKFKLYLIQDGTTFKQKIKAAKVE